jgi:hypothetical protein
MISAGSLALRLYRGVAEPARALALRKRRLAAFGLDPVALLPAIEIDPLQRETCAPACRFDGAARSVVVDHYLERADAGPAWLAPVRNALRITPTVVDLARYSDPAAFEATLRRRSSRTPAKIRKAREAGYAVKRFPVAAHVQDVHAVKTSMRMRAGGPVMDYWFLKPGDIAEPAKGPVRLKRPACGNHWTQWWGVFLPEPGHAQNGVTVDERLVAYVKASRRGEVVHYADIMGHADHLGANVMALLHHEIMAWLLGSGDPMAAGVRAVLYGALEHGREGLVTWKKRAGFEPARLVRAADAALDPTATERAARARLSDLPARLWRR